jgi:uncharacterized protein (UPF0332 family)
MRKLKRQQIDFKQVGRFLAGAEKKLAAARKTFSIDEEATYQIAYEAMLKASLGFMLSFGFRPRSLPGHHVTIIEFAEKNHGKEFKSLISMFNRMRRKRHEAIYDVTGLISSREVADALDTAERYIKAIRDEVQKQNPQAKLL